MSAGADRRPLGVDEILGYSDPAQVAARESSVLARENQKLRQRLAEIERDASAQVEAFRGAARKAEAAPCRACEQRQQELDSLRIRLEGQLGAERASSEALLTEKEEAVQTGGRLLAEAREAARRERVVLRDAAEKEAAELTRQRHALEVGSRALRAQLEEARRAAAGVSSGRDAAAAALESAVREAEERSRAAEDRAASCEAELVGCRAQLASARSELSALRLTGEGHLRRGEQLAQQLNEERKRVAALEQGERDGARQREAKEQAARAETAELRASVANARDEIEQLRRSKSTVEAERRALNAQHAEMEKALAGAAASVTAEREAREAERRELEAELKRVGLLLSRARKEAAAERERAEGRARESDALRSALVAADAGVAEQREGREAAAAEATRLRVEVGRLQALLEEARRPRPPNSFGAYVALRREVTAATREVEVMRMAAAEAAGGTDGGTSSPVDVAAAVTRKAALAVEQAMGGVNSHATQALLLPAVSPQRPALPSHRPLSSGSGRAGAGPDGAGSPRVAAGATGAWPGAALARVGQPGLGARAGTLGHPAMGGQQRRKTSPLYM
jgi:hypothetical protein